MKSLQTSLSNLKNGTHGDKFRHAFSGFDEPKRLELSLGHFRCSISRSKRLRNRRPLPGFSVVYGVSNNDRAPVDNALANTVLKPLFEKILGSPSRRINIFIGRR